MAKLLACEDWVETESLAMHLHYDLPDDYVVVADPTVHGCALDMVVVAPQGLFVLHEDGADEASPPRSDEEAGEPSSAEGTKQQSGDERVKSATAALKAFLADEFPSLNPKVHHLLLRDEPQPDSEPSGEVRSVGVDTVVEQISATEVPDNGALPAWQERVDLAVALRDRRLTATQRASEPFVFRSGHVFSSGTEVWTIRGAVRRMDADPESAIYHLRNDTLAEWLHDQGAEHLSRLAREVMRQDTDHRTALETFLLGTGLVSRPKLELRPRKIELGYVLAGEGVARRIRLRKGRGRGYLFGELEPGIPWLSVHPNEFHTDAGWSEVTVRAETESLPIGRDVREEVVYVHSNASEDPIEVPVELRVVGVPSALNRYAMRPAVTLAVGALLGAAVGWLLTARGAPASSALDQLAWLPAPTTVWVALMALIWAAFGALRGALQPLAWPIGYTLKRWLGRIGVWVVSLGLAGAAVSWGWAALRATDMAARPAMVSWLLVWGPTPLAIVPATIGEIRASRRMRDTSVRAIRWSFLRPLLLPLVVLLLALAVRFGAPLLRPLWRRVDWEGAVETVRAWAGERMTLWETRIQEVIDDLYLWYYDR